MDEKEKNLLEASQRIQILEKEIALRDAEVSSDLILPWVFPKRNYFLFSYLLDWLQQIAQCKGHISELNLHAEAQASEYKEKVGKCIHYRILKWDHIDFFTNCMVC